MLVDCETCSVRGLACGDCVVTVLWGLPEDSGAGEEAASGGGGPVRLDQDDRAALRALADAGLVPRLRHDAGAAPRGRPDHGSARREAS